MTTTSHAVRPLRKDAAQHRQQLLDAAVQVFNEQGLDASVTEIARVAGVGIGTLYRRFPTKEALVDALVHEILTTTIQMARDALTVPDGTGLERFLETSSAYQAEHAGYLRRLWNTDHEMVKTARHLIARLLVDAKKHDLIRHDLTSTDLSIAMFSLLGVLEATLPVAPNAWRRHLDLLIAGMRPASSVLPHRAMSSANLDRIQATHAAGDVLTRLSTSQLKPRP
jgi:AcrR family transcriptional regulator